MIPWGSNTEGREGLAGLEPSGQVEARRRIAVEEAKDDDPEMVLLANCVDRHFSMCRE